MLLYYIDIFVLSFGFVDLPNVHGVELHRSHLVQPASLPHMQTRDFKFCILERSIEESLEHILGKHGSHCSCFFTLSATTSENFDSCSTSVSSPLHDSHLVLIHVLIALGRYGSRHRRGLFYH